MPPPNPVADAVARLNSINQDLATIQSGLEISGLEKLAVSISFHRTLLGEVIRTLIAHAQAAGPRPPGKPTSAMRLVDAVIELTGKVNELNQAAADLLAADDEP